MPNKLNSVIVRTLAAKGDKGERDCEVLFDSGATDSFVSRRVAEALGTILPLTDANVYTLADGSKLQVAEGVTLTLYLDGRRIRDEFKINPSSSGSAHVDEVILGATTMRKHGMSVDFKHNDVVFSMQSAANPGARQHEGVLNMDEKFKRILARMGVTEISDSLTDEDAISMICERTNRSYQAVAAPVIAPKEEASEPKVAKTPDVPAVPTPSGTGFFTKLFAKLGITSKDDVTEAQAIDLVAAQVKKPAPATAVACPGVLKALAIAETATEDEVIGAILAIQDPGNVITVDRHQELEHQHRAFRMESIIMDGIRNGKAYPHEKDDLLAEAEEWNAVGRDGLVIIENKLNRRHKMMPIGERLPVKTAHETDFDDATMAVAKQMGVSPETMKKYAQ